MEASLILVFESALLGTAWDNQTVQKQTRIDLSVPDFKLSFFSAFFKLT